MKFNLTIFLLFFTISLFSQPCSKNFPCDTVEGEPIFISVDKTPLFEGKDLAEFANYIAMNIKYPASAIEDGISGTVYVRFIINKKGELISPAVIQGVHPKLDKEVLKVVKSSPAWTPGEIDGTSVSVQYILPVKFNFGI